MKFICLQENLKKGLAVVSHINNKNINLPILNNILIRSNESGLELVSTNLEIGITHQLRAKVDEPGETTVDAKIISDYVNLLPAERLNLMNETTKPPLSVVITKQRLKESLLKSFH